ncbi:MAG TPA: chorismate-binding protein [Gemmatimonadales bacterium]|nr:chorismate-binding protein [Gemmatimonadales bacterium]
MTRDTSFAAFRATAREGHVVPVVRELVADTLTPVSAYAALARPPFGFLLESLVGGERWARYTFLGTEPSEAWRYRGGRVEAWVPGGTWRDAGAAPDPLADVAARVRPLRAVTVSGLPRFTGGAVGYLGYDVVRGIERLGTPPQDDRELPDAVCMLADTVVIFDNAFARAIIVANTRPASMGERDLRAAYDDAERRIGTLVERLAQAPALPPLALADAPPVQATSPFTRAAFERAVRAIKEHIAAGDIFQAVLSRRQDVAFDGDAYTLYRALRALNPAPYLYFLALDDVQVAGSSPEVLVRVEDGEVTVRPIAGTRPRGATREADDALAAELRDDPKELAEHAMLVDLGRNDVGRTAAFGTVRLTADRELERYSHVQHLVSEVRGTLRPGLDAVDALRAAFPAGTVSGAPKVRAMEILDALEPTRRGPYAGAVGYLGWGAAALDTAIAIRTATLRGGRAWVQAGAGIVADSDPAREFEETESKARAVLAALALAAATGSRTSEGDDIFPGRGLPH